MGMFVDRDEREATPKGKVQSSSAIGIDEVSPIAIGIDEVSPTDSVTETRCKKWEYLERISNICCGILLTISSVIGSVFITLFSESKVVRYQVWKWAFWISAVCASYWISEFPELVFNAFANFHLTKMKHLTYWLMGTRDSLRMLLWSGLNLLAFALLFHSHDGKTRSGDVYVVCIRTLICIIIFSLANTICVFAAKYASSIFHKENHFAEMQASVKKEYFLHLLSQQNIEYSEEQRVNARRGSTLVVEDVRDSIVNDERDAMEVMAQVHKMGKYIRQKKAAWTFAESLDGSFEGLHNEAADLSRKIMVSVTRDPSLEASICRDDLRLLVPEPLIDDAFKTIDRDASGTISLQDLEETCRDILAKRGNLVATLNDTNTIIGQLELVMKFAIQVLCIFAYLLVFDANIKQIWLSFSSLVLIFTYIFGTSIRDLYETISFIFLAHAFDVGDLITLDTGDVHVVQSISMNSMTLRLPDNTLKYFPTSKMRNEVIVNLSRSSFRKDAFKIFLDIGTPHETFNRLKDSLEDFLRNHQDRYKPECAVYVVANQDPMKIQCSVSWTYHGNAAGKHIEKSRHEVFLFISDFLAKNENKAEYTFPKTPDANLQTAEMVSTLLKPELSKFTGRL